ncbi:acyltransferase [Kineosporia sp. R_H_3]|uniref:acyltransferase family protein n=1 Tax=Kineosporia sp. R_H_3 TaxID=1961848 RepID=UPI00130406B4|nr:acyltransferase [Kineosporia sp. R_H_3]
MTATPAVGAAPEVDSPAPLPLGAPAGRPPTRPGHDLPVLEVYRAAAAALVLLTHVGFESGAGTRGPWAGWLARGDAGVAVFFVLSGFLLMRPRVLAARGLAPVVRAAPYLWRRAVRLLPAYLLAVAGLALLVPGAAARPAADWVRAWTLTSVYHEGPLLPGFTHTWSLGTEISFYVALPLLAVLWLGRSGRSVGTRWDAPRVLAVVVLLVAVSTAWRLGWATSPAGRLAPLYWLPGYLDWFAAGMGLAWLRERRDDGGPRWLREAAAAPGAWFAMAAATYWVCTTRLVGPYDLSPATAAESAVKHVLYLVLALVLLVPAVFGDPAARWQVVARSRPLVWAGTVSYGFFLWHMVVLIAIVQRFDLRTFDIPFLPLLAATAVPALALSALSWHLVERPLQRRLRHVVR